MKPAEIMFSPSARRWQERLGSRAGYRRVEEKGGFRSEIDDDLAAFVAERDSFYLATASAAGRPYVQHRGGPKGFLKVIDERTLGFADYAGNKQYISAGHLEENDQAFLFLMDYPNRRRIKIWGRARVVEDDAALLERLADAEYGARLERAIVFTIEAWDVNCPQHVTPRYTMEELGEARSLGLDGEARGAAD